MLMTYGARDDTCSLAGGAYTLGHRQVRWDM
jgi:hypothetical protein